MSYNSGNTPGATAAAPDRPVKLKGRSATAPGSLARNFANSRSPSACGSRGTATGRHGQEFFFASDQQTEAHPKGPRFSWNVTAQDLKPLPPFYSLQQTSIFVEGLPACVLAARISNFLRINSIAANYGRRGERKAEFPRTTTKATAEALTENFLKFLVFLWAPRSGSGTILEVQRMGGCSVEFHVVCRALFEVALAITQPIPIKQDFMEGRWGIPEAAVCANAEGTGQRPTHGLVGSLNITLSLLESRKRDRNRLGLESLVTLTNPGKVAREDALSVSCMLLLGKNSFAARLRGAVISYVERPKGQVDVDESEEYDSDDDFETFADEHNVITHNLALRSLANALRVGLTAEGIMSASEKETASHALASLVPFFVADIEDAENRPHDAALSEICLRHLVCYSAEARRMSHDIQVLPVLMGAYEFGKERHFSLEVESLNLLLMLTSSLRGT